MHLCSILLNPFSKTNSPSLNDILKQNPDIMRNISQAAVQQMGPAMGEDLVGNLMKEGIQQTIDRRSQQSPMQQPMMMPTGPPLLLHLLQLVVPLKIL